GEQQVMPPGEHAPDCGGIVHVAKTLPAQADQAQGARDQYDGSHGNRGPHPAYDPGARGNHIRLWVWSSYARIDVPSRVRHVLHSLHISRTRDLRACSPKSARDAFHVYAAPVAV